MDMDLSTSRLKGKFRGLIGTDHQVPVKPLRRARTMHPSVEQLIENLNGDVCCTFTTMCAAPTDPRHDKRNSHASI